MTNDDHASCLVRLERMTQGRVEILLAPLAPGEGGAFEAFGAREAYAAIIIGEHGKTIRYEVGGIAVVIAGVHAGCRIDDDGR